MMCRWSYPESSQQRAAGAVTARPEPESGSHGGEGPGSVADVAALSALQRTGKDLRQIGVELLDDDLQHGHARVVLPAFESADDVGVHVGFSRQGFLTQLETLTPFADFLAQHAKDRSVAHASRLISRTE